VFRLLIRVAGSIALRKSVHGLAERHQLFGQRRVIRAD
jgi:hypothetical protein